MRAALSLASTVDRPRIQLLFDLVAWIAVSLTVIFATRRLAFFGGFHEPNIVPGCLAVAIITGAAWVCLREAIFHVGWKTERRMILAAFALILMQIVARFLHVMRYGTDGIGYYQCPYSGRFERPSAYFVTIPKNEDRACSVGCELRANQFNAVQVDGIQASHYTDTRDMIEKLGMQYPDEYAPDDPKIRYKTMLRLSMTLSYRSAVLRAAAEDNSTLSEWIFMVEDDAVLLVDPGEFERVLCYYTVSATDVDMVWLDTRNSFPFWTSGSPGGGVSGALFRRSSAAKIAEIWRWNGARMQVAMQVPGTRDILPQHDVMLMKACGDGTLICSAVPLVRESGARSTNYYVRPFLFI